jgi:hypothetical protein
MATSGSHPNPNPSDEHSFGFESDDIGYGYLTSTLNGGTMRLGVIGHDERPYQGRFSKLCAAEQQHVLRIPTVNLPEFLNAVGDAVQDDMLDWITEHTHGPWSVRGGKPKDDDPESDDDRVVLRYSFAESTDAVQFKLRWADRVLS